MTQGAASCPWDNGFSAENRRCRIVRGVGLGVRSRQNRRSCTSTAVAGTGGQSASMEIARSGCAGTTPRQRVHLRHQVPSEVGSVQRGGKRLARELFERHFGRKDPPKDWSDLEGSLK